MEKIIKPSDYAKEMGISRQAVYAKIKKGILKSKEIDGKLYIIVDDKIPKTNTKQIQTTKPIQNSNYEELLKAKDETINVLKDTIKDLKESNKEISTTLRGEIDLLKEAFYEMRVLYTNQLEHKQPSDIEPIQLIQEKEVIDDVEEIHKWVGIKKFYKKYQIKEKHTDKYKKVFKKLYKNNDPRILKEDNKFKLDILQDFSDILDI